MTIAVRKSVSAQAFTTGSIDTNATGSLFVIYAATFTAGGTISVSDNKGNTYVQIGTQQTPGGAIGTSSALFYKENGVGGVGHTFSCANSGKTHAMVIGIEITGALLSGSLDATPTPNETTTSPYLSNFTGTLAQAAELILAFMEDDRTGTTNVPTWANSFSLLEDQANSAEITGGCGQFVVSATTSVQASLTLSTSTTVFYTPVTFKAAALDPGIRLLAPRISLTQPGIGPILQAFAQGVAPPVPVVVVQPSDTSNFAIALPGMRVGRPVSLLRSPILDTTPTPPPFIDQTAGWIPRPLAAGTPLVRQFWSVLDTGTTQPTFIDNTAGAQIQFLRAGTPVSRLRSPVLDTVAPPPPFIDQTAGTFPQFMKLGTPISRLRSAVLDTGTTVAVVPPILDNTAGQQPQLLRLGTPSSRIRSAVLDTGTTPSPFIDQTAGVSVQFLKLGTPLSLLRSPVLDTGTAAPPFIDQTAGIQPQPLRLGTPASRLRSAVLDTGTTAPPFIDQTAGWSAQLLWIGTPFSRLRGGNLDTGTTAPPFIDQTAEWIPRPLWLGTPVSRIRSAVLDTSAALITVAYVDNTAGWSARPMWLGTPFSRLRSGSLDTGIAPTSAQIALHQVNMGVSFGLGLSRIGGLK